jgi:hypothetical protein
LSKAFCDFELEAKIVFDVDGHHFKPSMEIIFLIHTLLNVHLDWKWEGAQR